MPRFYAKLSTKLLCLEVIFLAKVRDHQKYMNRDVPNFEFGSKFEKSSRFFGFGSSFAGSNLPRTELFENFNFVSL